MPEVVGTWLQNNPDRSNERAVILVMDAFREAWPNGVGAEECPYLIGLSFSFFRLCISE